MAPLTKNRRNGHNNPMETPFDGGSQSDLERIFSQADMPSVIREFVHPGTDPSELHMRCVYTDANMANAALIFERKCLDFGLEDYLVTLAHKLASTVSEKGRSRKEVLQATTGVVVPGLYSDARFERRDRRDEERT